MVLRLLGLSAYMTLVRGNAPEETRQLPERPEGELVWGHAGSRGRVLALCDLAERLAVQRPGLRLLLTVGEDTGALPDLPSRVIVQTVPPESIPAIEAFLAHWAPDLCIWTVGHLRPALIECSAEAGIPMFLVDAADSGFEGVRGRPWPDPARAVLRHFECVMASSANASRRLVRLGVATERISVSGTLQSGTSALPCNEDEREALEAAIGGRPVWLAALVQASELQVIIDAHRAALRSAHRRLLIVVPDDPSQGVEMAQSLRAKGWRVARWSLGEVPQEVTQILLVDTDEHDLGLWYRLAPITFMGSSLDAGHGGRDPFGPAALGSAILHGPNVARYRPAYTRFSEAGAARSIKDAETLAAALTHLTAPDQAAAMAHAAWTVATDGAEVTNRVVDLAQDALDRQEGA